MIMRGERLNAQRELLTYIGEQLKHHGFGPKPVGQDFWQKKAVGKWAFHISFIPHWDDFDLTANVAVRINEIENLVNKYDTKYPPARKTKSMTLGVELGNFSQGRPLRWTISDIEEISMIGDAVMNAYDRIAWPFLEQHSDLASAGKVLISDDRRDTLLAPFVGPRYMRAVAATYLLGESQKLLSLIPPYETKLRERNDLYLENFLALCRGIGVMPR